MREMCAAQHLPFLNKYVKYVLYQKCINFAVNKWKKANRLEFLGIPTYWGSGLSEYKETRYGTSNVAV